MLRPSYTDLMQVLNEDEKNTITSRYSIVIASAKRARELVDGAEPYVKSTEEDKPVSVSIEELYNGHFRLISNEQ